MLRAEVLDLWFCRSSVVLFGSHRWHRLLCVLIDPADADYLLRLSAYSSFVRPHLVLISISVLGGITSIRRPAHISPFVYPD